MKIKDGVILNGLDIRMRHILVAADDVWSQFGKELVVTCGLDGEHSAGSLHYYGLALDFRTNYFDPQTRFKVANALRKRLSSPCIEVIVESTHIHVEYDVSKELCNYGTISN